MIRTSFVLMTIVSALSLTTVAAAQLQPMRVLEGLDEAMQPDFVRRDMGTLAQELQLTPDQQPIVEAIFAEYESQFDEVVKELQKQLNNLSPNMGAEDAELQQKRDALRQRVAELAERMQTIGGEGVTPEQIRERQAAIRAEAEAVRAELQQLQQPNIEPSQMRQLAAQASAMLEAWDTRKAGLRQEFVDDLLTVLTDDQRQLWPSAQRRLIREKSLPRGRLSGESVDLHIVVGELKSSSDVRLSLAGTLEEYSVRLDAALTSRNQGITRLRREWIRAMQDDGDDESGSMLARQMEFRVALRNVNDEFANRIAAELPGALSGEFAQAYRSRAYPRIFRSTQAQRVFNAALELADLTDAQRAAVNAIHSNYLTELARANEDLVAIVRAHEPSEQPRRRARPSRDQEPQASDPIVDGFASRNELGSRFLEQLRGELTPEQLAQLPTGRLDAAEAQPGESGNRRDNRERASRDTMIRQFDTNGDGVLDAQEREAMREHIRERRRGPAGSGSRP